MTWVRLYVCVCLLSVLSYQNDDEQRENDGNDEVLSAVGDGDQGFFASLLLLAIVCGLFPSFAPPALSLSRT